MGWKKTYGKVLCTLRGDLLQHIARLYSELVHSTGSSLSNSVSFFDGTKLFIALTGNVIASQQL